ncbi:CLUMA_CG008904, isoform A [Clunio marinus]|uniref:CLUMA_CG008904, isoform A n=1 Tax=Clunio marinus TaxID=568069 RepID=A0A1J1I511_9DIPT|nr:CLUMA_CG008904, isoform A [Clunio marinus]
MISPVMLALYQFCSGMSSEIGDVDNTFHYYQQTYNLIESIINWDNSNIEFWLIISEPTSPSDPEIKCKFLDNVIPKLLTRSTNVSFTDTRNFAALFFTDNNNDEKQLNMSLKLPPDVIKIYLNHNGCQLDEAKLADIVDILWASAEISFIYYISFCNCSITDNYGSVDDVRRRPHKDIHGCIINLFYHQPFVRNKSGQWGVLTKMPLINEQEGVERQLINTSSQAFHYFPFQRKHNLNFNQMNMTVILFESANAYLKQEMNIFRYKLSASILENPHYLLDAYFGMDAELLRMLKTTLNFTVNISPTSDRQLYGFRKKHILNKHKHEQVQSHAANKF